MTLQLAILIPVLFAIMFLGVQAALYHHARTMAIAAAQEGARAAGTEAGREHDGIAAATDFISINGDNDVIQDARATATRTTTTASVTVTGYSLSVIPGWHPRVAQTASVPVERLTAP